MHTETKKRDWLWPALIAGGFIVVVSVNVLFIVVAVRGADEVVPSYVAEGR